MRELLVFEETYRTERSALACKPLAACLASRDDIEAGLPFRHDGNPTVGWILALKRREEITAVFLEQ